MNSTYRARSCNRHCQTIIPGVLKCLWELPNYGRPSEIWDTPDGDFIQVDWADKGDGKPLLVLFHGLEGNSRAHYARRVGRIARKNNWSFAVPQFRGCSDEPSRGRWGYHAGDFQQVSWILREFRQRHVGEIHAVGISIGGSALLRWLSELPAESVAIVRRAVSVSAPLDLALTGGALSRGMGRFYSQFFLFNDLRNKALARLARYPGIYEEHCVRAARTLRDFDDAVTAPLYGFRDVRDYYEQASAGPRLARIRVPTLVLNARDDPFLPECALDAVCTVSEAMQLSRYLTLDFPEDGGHAGFLGNGRWLERRVFEFLAEGLPA